MSDPTPHRDVNVLLEQLLEGAHTILGQELVAAYLFGSLANGGFDQDSDIDVLVVTVDELNDERFARLYAMHERLSAIDSPWAIQLEVSYIPQDALRRYDPSNNLHPHIDRGHDEKLHLKTHNEGWLVQRHTLRKQGTVLLGPSPQTLIDPVSPDQLRAAMKTHVQDWAAEIDGDSSQLDRRGGQSYAVLSFCRILYTLRHGAVASKPAAARWAQETLEPRWSELIEGAWYGRHHPNEEARAEDIQATIALAHYALEQATRP